MAFPKPSEIQDQYFRILKSVKPSINTNDINSDFVIRGKTVSGVMSGIYGDQQKVDNDTFISSARPEALLLKGQDYAIPRQPATYAKSGQIRVPGTNGTIVNPGDLTFLYRPTNVLYTNTTGGTVSGGFIDVSIQCNIQGQLGNVATPDTLAVISPPTGIQQTASVEQSIADGSDIETFDSYRARLLSRQQEPPAGGNVTDYPKFAFEADPSVRSARVRRFGRGLGTMDIYITTGSTDIDTAVTNGQSIVRIPSPTTLAIVQAYYDTHAPETDMPRVYAPTETEIDATVKVILVDGLTLSSVPASPIYNPLNLTCGQLIEREIGRILYKQPVGGRTLPGESGGWIVAADIEAALDEWLSGVNDAVTGALKGKIPILADRQIEPLDGANYDKSIGQNELVIPGDFTIILGV